MCAVYLGLLSEIHMPIDSFTKKPKGFAFITFVIPENAVKAYSELDRQSFQVKDNNVQLTTVVHSCHD